MGCRPSKHKVEPAILNASKSQVLSPKPTKKKKRSTQKGSTNSIPPEQVSTQPRPPPTLSPPPAPPPQPLEIIPEKYLLSTAPDFSVPYNVVSHVWGKVSPQQHHRSNRLNLLVSSPEKLDRITALADATKMPLWVDFFSIDQTNPSDKCHQIGIMRDIYSKAVKTYVCLTCPEKIKLDELVGVDFERAATCRAGKKYDGEDCAEIRNRVQKFSDALSVYNSRIWTLQEAILSRNLYYTCCCLSGSCSRTVVSRSSILTAIETVAQFYACNAPHEMITAQLKQYREDVGVILGVLEQTEPEFKKKLVQFMLSRGCSQIQDYYFGVQAVAGFTQQFDYTTRVDVVVNWLAAYTFPLLQFDCIAALSNNRNWFTPVGLNLQGRTMQEVFRITANMNLEPTVCDIHANGVDLVCYNTSIASFKGLGPPMAATTWMEVLDFAYMFGTLQFKPSDNLAGKQNNTDRMHVAVSQVLILIAVETGLLEEEPNVFLINKVFDYLDRGARRYGYFGFCDELQRRKMDISIAARNMRKQATMAAAGGTVIRQSLLEAFPRETALCELLTVVLWAMRMSEDGWYNPFPSFLWKFLSESLAFACSSAGLALAIQMDGSITASIPSDYSPKPLYAMKLGVVSGGSVFCLVTDKNPAHDSELICLGGRWFLSTTSVDKETRVCLVNRLTPVIGVFSDASAYSPIMGIQVSQITDYESLVIIKQ
ncbi:heterokaryon incompatibility protein-domain-containing protein [Obelidium mucronatum]|nr:heterokaryon incompatibility protein-domain-containing protein [Obelidium mucronatum]KAI9334134.1 heterokaryon incompatibility protein-domain-containing protein [Obelidium mucronatum]